ncbi:ras-related protein Rab-8A-like [Liolophura sinensis]|uniref:ras-related protein Rab-8A-like n=1 Tax=Liolophura sinensis TaxID=3198878 RepID=UPI003158A04D
MVDSDSCDYSLKVILCGDVGVGKTTLLFKYVTGRYNCMLKASDDMGVRNKVIKKDGHNIRLLIWDTAGQERFRSMTNSYYRNTHGCLLLFDVTKSSSLDSVLRWYHELKEFCTTMPKIILVGTKCHLPREVSPGRAEKLAEHLNVPYMEVSPELDVNVTSVFESLVELVTKDLDEQRRNLLMLHKSLMSQSPEKKVLSCGC